MIDKELEEYVRAQRALGVPDHEIKKALLAAGHGGSDIKALFGKDIQREFRPIKNKNEFSLQLFESKHIAALNILVLVVFSIFAVYITFDYNRKISAVSAEQTEFIEQVNKSLASQEKTLGMQLDSLKRAVIDDVSSAKNKIEEVEDGVMKTIREYNNEALLRDNSLSDSIQKISNKSRTDLSSFEQQLTQFKKASVDFSAVIPDATNAVVTIGTRGTGYFTTSGSGVIIDDYGYVVTNNHVIDELRQIYVKTHDGSDYAARIVGRDTEWDIALLKLHTNKNNFKKLGWADSSKVSVGDHIIAIGNPVGFESTVTEGIISNTDRVVNGNKISYLQTDVAINAGNSGGPLIDKNGKIVGIATLKYARSGFEGLSFALKSNDVKRIVMRMMAEE